MTGCIRQTQQDTNTNDGDKERYTMKAPKTRCIQADTRTHQTQRHTTSARIWRRAEIHIVIFACSTERKHLVSNQNLAKARMLPNELSLHFILIADFVHFHFQTKAHRATQFRVSVTTLALLNSWTQLTCTLTRQKRAHLP